MKDPSGNGLTNKELIFLVWEDVKTLRREVAPLVQAHAAGEGSRKWRDAWRGAVAGAVAALLISAAAVGLAARFLTPVPAAPDQTTVRVDGDSPVAPAGPPPPPPSVVAPAPAPQPPPPEPPAHGGNGDPHPSPGPQPNPPPSPPPSAPDCSPLPACPPELPDLGG